MSNLSENFKVKNGLTVNTTISAGSCVEADSFKKHDGTSSQFLKADGSVDSTSYTDCVGTITGFDNSGDGTSVDSSDPAGVLVEVDSTVARTNSANERFDNNLTIAGDLSSVGATYTDCLVVGGSTLDGTNGTTLNGDFVVQASTGQDYLKVSAGNVCFNTGGGVTQMGSANLGARVNIQAISDAVPTLAVRGKSGSSDLVRVSSASCTNGDYFNINNDGKIGIGQASPSAKMEIVNNSTTVDTLLLKTTDNDSDAAPIQTFKRESESPQGGDYLGQLKFKGLNDSCQEVVYSKITGKINDEQGGTEGGLFETAVQKSGTMTIVARQTDTDLKLINGTGLQVDGQILSAGTELHSILGGGGGGSVNSVTPGSCNITIGGTASNPTVSVTGGCFTNCAGTVTCVDTASTGAYLSGGGTTVASIGIKSTCAERWEPPAFFQVNDSGTQDTTGSFVTLAGMWDTPSLTDASRFSWNGTTGVVTVLKDGVVDINAHILGYQVTGNNRTELNIRVRHNGSTTIAQDSQYSVRNTVQRRGGAYIHGFKFDASANDTFEVQIRDVGTPIQIGNADALVAGVTYFNVTHYIV